MSSRLILVNPQVLSGLISRHTCAVLLVRPEVIQERSLPASFTMIGYAAHSSAAEPLGRLICKLSAAGASVLLALPGSSITAAGSVQRSVGCIGSLHEKGMERLKS